MIRIEKNTIWIITLVLIAIIPTASAIQANFETAGVGRIVGDSVDEVVGQLGMRDVNIESASIYTDDERLSRRAIEENKTISSYFGKNSRFISRTWSWDKVKENLAGAKKSELLIIQSEGELSDETPKAGDGTHALGQSTSPPSWPELKAIKPIILLDSDFAGLYLPKSADGSNSFVGQLGQDSLYIAATGENDHEFAKAFICNLGKNNIEGTNSLGETFRDSRNAYYWQSSKASGLALMSYEYYGNPDLKISLPNIEQDILNENCKPYIQDASATIPAKASISSKSMDTMEELIELTYSLETQNNLTIINIPQGVQRKAEGMLILPQKTAVQEFPSRTIISGTSFQLEDAAEITINLSTWNGTSATEADCWNQNITAGISFSHASSSDLELVIAEISPVEIINCSEGKARIYRKIRYATEYSSNSPVIIKSVNAPALVIPDSSVTINATLKNINPFQVTGNLSVLSESLLNSTEITLNPNEIKTFRIAFQTNQSTTYYSLQFIESGEEKAKKSFVIRPEAVELQIISPPYQAPGLNVPSTLLINNKLSTAITADIEAEAIADGTSLKPFKLQENLKPGANSIFLIMENLQAGTYTLKATAKTEYGSYTATSPLIVVPVQYSVASSTISRFSDGTTQKPGKGNITIPKTAIIRNATISVSGSNSVNTSIYVDGMETARIIGKLDGETAVIDTFSNGKAEETLSSAENFIVSRTISMPKSSNIESVTLSIGTLQVQSISDSKPEREQTPLMNISGNSAENNSESGNMSIRITTGTYCSDWYSGPNNGVLTINLGLYCANNWKVNDINNDGQAEYYLLTGTTHTMWSSCESKNGYKILGWTDRNANIQLGCTYNYDTDLRLSTSYCDSTLEHTYYEKTYSSPTLTMQARDMYCKIKSTSSSEWWYWGWKGQDMILKDPSGKNRMVVNCGIDNDCSNDKQCKKPTISNPTSYYCDTPSCQNLNCPEWKTQQNSYNNHQCNSECTLNSGRCETPGAEIDNTHYCDSNHYIQTGIKKKISANGNVVWTGFGFKTETINLTSHFKQAIQNCQENSQGTCSIPIQFTSDSSNWELKLNSVNAKYKPKIELSNAIQNKLNICGSEICDITINASSATMSNPEIEYELYNYVPIVSLNSEITINEGETANLNLNAFDIKGDKLTTTISRPFNNSDIWHTNYKDSGTYTISITISDGTYETKKTSTIHINNINLEPAMEFMDDKQANEGENVTIEIHAYDTDGDVLTYTINDTRFERNQNTFTWQTEEGDAGNYSVKISASDGEDTASQQVEITVNQNSLPMTNIGIALIIQSPQNNTITSNTIQYLTAETDTDSTCYYQKTICSNTCTEYPQQKFSVTNSLAHLQVIDITQEGEYTLSILCNNTYSANTTTIRFTKTPTPMPNLLPTSIIPVASGRSIQNNTDFDSGETIFFDTGIINLGSQNAEGFNIKWFLDGILKGYGSHTGIQAGATEMNGNSQYIWTTTPGTHNLTFVVDADNYVSESDESNNQIEYEFTVSNNQKSIELVLTGIIASGNQISDRTYNSNEQIYFDTGITNFGNLNSEPFNIKWLIDGNVKGYGGHTGIQAGATEMNGNTQYIWTTPTPGEHNITFIVDADNHIIESDESNNQVEYIITVV